METLLLLVILFSLLAVLSLPAFLKKAPRDPPVKSNDPLHYAKCCEAMAPDQTRFLDFLTPLAAPARDVLELGCGTGARIGALPHTLRATGLDTSPELLVLAERRYAPRVTFRAGDPQNPALFPTEHFDLVFCCGDALFYAANKELVFYSVRRWLEPGGLFVVNVELPRTPPAPAATNVTYTATWLSSTRRRDRVLCGGETYTTVHTLYPETEATILRVAKRAGFELVGEVTAVNHERYAVLRADAF